MSKLLTINQAAKILGVSTKTLRRWEDLKYFIPDRDPHANIRLYHPVALEYWKELLIKSKEISEHMRKLEPLRREVNKYLVMRPLAPGEKLPMMDLTGFSVASNAEDVWMKEWDQLIKEFLKFPEKMRAATAEMEAEEKNEP